MPRIGLGARTGGTQPEMRAQGVRQRESQKYLRQREEPAVKARRQAGRASQSPACLRVPASTMRGGAVERAHQLDPARPQKGVDRPDPEAAPAAVDEDPGIAREGRRVARDQREARQARRGERRGLRPGAGARRIDHERIEAGELGAGERRALQIAALGRDAAAASPARRAACSSAASMAGSRSTACDRAPGRGERQAERAAAGEQIGDAPGVADRLARPRRGSRLRPPRSPAGTRRAAARPATWPNATVGARRCTIGSAGVAASGHQAMRARSCAAANAASASRSARLGGCAAMICRSRPLALAVASTSPPAPRQVEAARAARASAWQQRDQLRRQHRTGIERDRPDVRSAP